MRILLRIVALGLIPCLLTDSAAPIGLSLPTTQPLANPSVSIPFQVQALSLKYASSAYDGPSKTLSSFLKVFKWVPNPHPRFGGGAASFADRLSDEQRQQIEDIIYAPGADKTPLQPDVSKFALLSPEAAELARRVRSINVYLLEKLTDFDKYLIAHAGVGGEVYDEHDPRQFSQGAVYFSPASYQMLLDLSPAAQMQFWAHELEHLAKPGASEDYIRARFPIDLLQMEAALDLYKRVFKGKGAVSDALKDVRAQIAVSRAVLPASDLDNRKKLVQVRSRMASIAMLMNTRRIDYFNVEKSFATDPEWAMLWADWRRELTPEKRRELKSVTVRRQILAERLIAHCLAAVGTWELREADRDIILRQLNNAQSILERAPVAARDAALDAVYETNARPDSYPGIVGDLNKKILMRQRALSPRRTEGPAIRPSVSSTAHSPSQRDELQKDVGVLSVVAEGLHSTPDTVIEALSPTLGQPMSDGFFFTRWVHSLVNAFNFPLVLVSLDTASGVVLKIRFFFDSELAHSIAFKNDSKSFAVDVDPDQAEEWAGERLENPGTKDMAPFLKRIPGDPVLARKGLAVPTVTTPTEATPVSQVSATPPVREHPLHSPAPIQNRIRALTPRQDVQVILERFYEALRPPLAAWQNPMTEGAVVVSGVELSKARQLAMGDLIAAGVSIQEANQWTALIRNWAPTPDRVSPLLNLTRSYVEALLPTAGLRRAVAEYRVRKIVERWPEVREKKAVSERKKHRGQLRLYATAEVATTPSKVDPKRKELYDEALRVRSKAQSRSRLIRRLVKQADAVESPDLLLLRIQDVLREKKRASGYVLLEELAPLLDILDLELPIDDNSTSAQRLQNPAIRNVVENLDTFGLMGRAVRAQIDNQLKTLVVQDFETLCGLIKQATDMGPTSERLAQKDMDRIVWQKRKASNVYLRNLVILLGYRRDATVVLTAYDALPYPVFKQLAAQLPKLQELIAQLPEWQPAMDEEKSVDDAIRRSLVEGLIRVYNCNDNEYTALFRKLKPVLPRKKYIPRLDPDALVGQAQSKKEKTRTPKPVVIAFPEKPTADSPDRYIVYSDALLAQKLVHAGWVVGGGSQNPGIRPTERLLRLYDRLLPFPGETDTRILALNNVLYEVTLTVTRNGVFITQIGTRDRTEFYDNDGHYLRAENRRPIDPPANGKLSFKFFANVTPEDPDYSEIFQMLRRGQWKSDAIDVWAEDADIPNSSFWRNALIVLDEGKPIGAIGFVANRKDRTVVEDGTYVEPNFRRRGVAPITLTTLVQSFGERGFEKMRVLPADDTPEAIAYETWLKGQTGVSELDNDLGTLQINLSEFVSKPASPPQRTEQKKRSWASEREWTLFSVFFFVIKDIHQTIPQIPTIFGDLFAALVLTLGFAAGTRYYRHYYRHALEKRTRKYQAASA